jgi:hypothetical protein
MLFKCVKYYSTTQKINYKKVCILQIKGPFILKIIWNYTYPTSIVFCSIQILKLGPLGIQFIFLNIQTSC